VQDCNTQAQKRQEAIEEVKPAPRALFLSVLLGVSLRRFFAVMHGVSCVSSSRVGVVCGLLMVSGVVVLGRFTVMMRSVRVVFRCLLVMFGSFLGHRISSMA
jgi:hypothetical protein